MLSPEGENRLQNILNLLQKSKDLNYTPKFSMYDIEWLAKKLKQKNDELSKVSEELYDVNKAFADYVEAHE